MLSGKTIAGFLVFVLTAAEGVALADSTDKNLAVALDYFTYLGGRERDWANAVAVDPSGSMYLTGTARSLDFPTVNAHRDSCAQGPNGSCVDVFVAKFSAAGELIYSTFLGSDEGDEGRAIAVDTEGNA